MDLTQSLLGKAEEGGGNKCILRQVLLPLAVCLAPRPWTQPAQSDLRGSATAVPQWTGPRGHRAAGCQPSRCLLPRPSRGRRPGARHESEARLGDAAHLVSPGPTRAAAVSIFRRAPPRRAQRQRRGRGTARGSSPARRRGPPGPASSSSCRSQPCAGGARSPAASGGGSGTSWGPS